MAPTADRPPVLGPGGRPSACEALPRRDAHDWLISAGEISVKAPSRDPGESGLGCRLPGSVANEPHSGESQESEQGGDDSSLPMRSFHVSPVLSVVRTAQVRQPLGLALVLVPPADANCERRSGVSPMQSPSSKKAPPLIAPSLGMALEMHGTDRLVRCPG